MYHAKTQLDHLLTPDLYRDEGRYDLEVERLFKPAWHAVATRRQLAKPGDYLTFELLGEPVILRNFDGTIRAFQNVCAHRHSRIVGRPCGNAPTLKCQYHGWEYNQDGGTGKIPEARCFRPWDRDNARLVRFPCETRGDIVFVSVDPDAGPLGEFLGEYDALMAERFSPPWRPCWHYETEYRANWKVPIENTLEGYHIECVHPKSFGTHPPEGAVEHRLGDGHSTLDTPVFNDWSKVMMGLLVRRLGGRPEGRYVHTLIHPHLVFIRMDVSTSLQLVVPTSPTTCRHSVIVYSRGADRWGPTKWLADRFLRAGTRLVTRMLVNEDLGVFEEIQRGLDASRQKGVFGAMEERLYHFQKWVIEQSDGAPAAAV